MADKYGGPTNWGSPQNWIGSTLGASDLLYHKLPNISPTQEAAKLAQLAPTLYNLNFGWNAPDIEAARKAEYRNLRQNVIPELASHYGSGMGSRGAFEQNLAAQQAGVQEKLASLQNQRQFELQKLRQEQLPRLFEQGLSPSFTGHITEQPFNPAYAPGETAAEQLEKSRPVQFAKSAVEKATNVAQKGVNELHKYLSEKPRTQAELKQQQELQKIAKKYGAPAAAQIHSMLSRVNKNAPKVATKELPVPVIDKIRSAYQYLGQLARGNEIPTVGVKEKPTPEMKQGFDLKQLVKKSNLPENVARYITPEYIPAIKRIMKRPSGRKALRELENADEILLLDEFLQENPRNWTKITDWLKKLFGGKAKE